MNERQKGIFDYYYRYMREREIEIESKYNYKIERWRKEKIKELNQIKLASMYYKY